VGQYELKASNAEGVKTGVDNRIKIVFPESGAEEVARETVAL
jgi:hypothetical protein